MRAGAGKPPGPFLFGRLRQHAIAHCFAPPGVTLGDTPCSLCCAPTATSCWPSPAAAASPGHTHAGLRVHTAAPFRLPADFTRVCAALVRPDGHIAWAGTAPNDTPLAEDLSTTVATRPRTTARN
ncbi:hypothetical protein [Streptomyces alboniger]|uniref:aromatic-ring hydroxylase C-terminal domain-containing protein n=1 Tax=Streptomyces alboniger TaxID=132473 RepID=UPI003D32E9CB